MSPQPKHARKFNSLYLQNISMDTGGEDLRFVSLVMGRAKSTARVRERDRSRCPPILDDKSPMPRTPSLPRVTSADVSESSSALSTILSAGDLTCRATDEYSSHVRGRWSETSRCEMGQVYGAQTKTGHHSASIAETDVRMVSKR